MTFDITRSDKNYILKKLKEIGMDKKEDPKTVEDEMTKVAKATDSFDGQQTDYYNTIYDKGELKNLDLVTQPNSAPTSDAPSITDGE